MCTDQARSDFRWTRNHAHATSRPRPPHFEALSSYHGRVSSRRPVQFTSNLPASRGVRDCSVPASQPSASRQGEVAVALVGTVCGGVQLVLSNRSTRLPALRERIASKVQTRAHAHRICHGAKSHARNRMWVCPALFFEASVQWQLEQKERYRAKCSKAWTRN